MFLTSLNFKPVPKKKVDSACKSVSILNGYHYGLELETYPYWILTSYI